MSSLNPALLALLREAAPQPLSAAEIATRLGLKKSQRKTFSRALQKLLNAGKLHRSRTGLISLPVGPSRKKQGENPRAVFVPAPRPTSRVRKENAPSREPARGREQGTASMQSPAELTGEIRFRSGGSAYVVTAAESAEAPAQTIQIAPAAAGTALHGDLVALRLVGSTRPPRGAQAKGGRRNQGRSNGRARDDDELRGEVLRVLSRSRDSLVGELRKSARQWFVTPDDPRFGRDVLVEPPARSPLRPKPDTGDKVVVRLDHWPTRSAPLSGTITARLGRTHEPRAELLGVLETYKLSPEFPPEVEAELATLPSKVRPAEIVGRRDYREVPTITIDPDDAKDFDDALSIEPLPKGQTRVGIHIADVAAYVRPDTALDHEAQRRGNSTYLVGTVIPMLPERLSNGLCSLVEGEDRLCKAVFLTFDAGGQIVGKDFASTVIRSRKRLTYKQAYALLFNDDLEAVRALPLPPKHQTGSTGRALSSLPRRELASLQIWVRRLWKIAAALRRERMARGSLDLDMPETKVYVDEAGYADRLERVDNDESHQLIEEFMLVANEAVAHLTRSQRLPSLYRVHDDPEPERLNELREELATHGLQVGNLAVRGELVRLLAQLGTHPQGHLLRTQLLRSLKKACYRASPDGHYGLSKRDYAHFTSPIRRYADLVVHRVLDAYLARKGGGSASGFAGAVARVVRSAIGAGARKPKAYTVAGVTALGEHLSQTELNSQAAERESVKIKLLEFFERELAKTPRTRFAAIVTDVRSTGFFVELTESMTFGFVPASVAVGAGGRGGRTRRSRFAENRGGPRVGDSLDVTVHKVDRFRRTIDFRPAE
ncbi:hypothetical protein AXK11_04565 [Cephaloticoccus primus]|uniref:Ribonuclease R n=1 Tax=Cephaloticoccus primus TaxID=1548207 RepID=A0A139SPB7_9BACT|nr:RNB domain-containing ribonuclease [Cephaloticoccus primus]KXU36428.1 hypothetical protein AXK11_04565 [Cephaloticoccus primus]